MNVDIDLSNIDIKTIEQAQDIAKMCTIQTGVHFVPVDHGPSRTPQFTIMRIPDVGIDVRAACQGKATPDGIIVHINEDATMIKTSGGNTYYRNGNTACFVNEIGWSLICGH